MERSIDILLEPLTRRERTILLYLAESKSNQEIAALETLALTSVKWYIQQIYAKLGVNRRGAVTERAQELGLLQPAPPPASGARRAKHNLPAQLTSFIGREREIVELRLRIIKTANRLLTLTGSGGTGKSRLALEVAGGILDAFPDGIWLVELAPLADPLLIPQTVIAALGLVEQANRTSFVFLMDYLAEKQLLLILDNCEHLVEATAELAGRLLQSAPGLTILVTSREILGVLGEMPYRVPPLGMPDPRCLPPLKELARYDAVRLFVDRARLVDPAFVITEENAAALAQITQQLDGIPLALELAATRLRLIDVGQIALRLNDVFSLLTGGSRTALPRHQTLQALIDWSYNLLTEAERRLLRGLSVFSGGWTLAAVEAVCGGSQGILDLLGQLADKSLILTVFTPGGETRYRMLETVRQYAHARLMEAGEAEAVRSRHLGYYLRLAEGLEPRLRGRDQISTLDELGRELDNLRQALEWALQTDVESELRLASAMQWFWDIRYHWAEGIAWLRQGLDAETFSQSSRPPEGGRALIRARALTTLGWLVLWREGHTSGKPFFEEALSLYKAGGPAHGGGLAWVLVWFGGAKLMEGNLAEGKDLVKEALRLFRENGDLQGLAECLYYLGDWEIDSALQKEIFLERLSIEQITGDIHGTATALFDLGSCATLDCDYEYALTNFTASREYHRQVGSPDNVAFLGMVLGTVSQLKGDLERAALFIEEALSGYREIVNERQVASCHFLIGQIAFAQGRYEEVATRAEKAMGIAKKTGDPEILAEVLYLHSRLARLSGKAEEARRLAEEGLNNALDSGDTKWLLLLDLGHLAFQAGDLAQAGALWRQGLAILLRVNKTPFLCYWVDVLAVLAARQGRLETAARLFGTRQWRGSTHMLSPIEYTERQTDLANIESELGEELFTRLQEEGRMLTFNEVLAITQEEG